MSTSKSGYHTVPAGNHDAQGSTSSTGPNLVTRVKRSPLLLGILTCVALVAGFSLALLLPVSSSTGSRYPKKVMKVGISEMTMKEGLHKCQKIAQTKTLPMTKKRRNPRVDKVAPILLKNATVWDGQGEVLDGMDVLMEDGLIKDMRRQIQAASDVKVIDVKGHVVSPGLVDMHSHIGVEAWPNLAATIDNNERTSPLTPFVRSLDSFNPSDIALRIAASGGITTVLALPGSANIIGGEAFVFKLRPVNTTSNADMLVQAATTEEDEPQRRYMKWACGENPKRVYGNKGQMPSTREAFLVREILVEAQKLKKQQDDWCSAATHTDKARLETPFPEELRLESLVALLRGEVLLNIHCYETHDLEAMVRHSLEFNFTIAAFHHALDAYRIPDILKRARGKITVATFVDHWGYKKEAYQASIHAPRILLDAGIPVAFKSDHPVLNSQHLVFDAAKGRHYGLTKQEAFKAVTSVPANAIGLGHRIGSLKVGYDADIIVWDREPLELGAAPLQVFIDGIALFEERAIPPAVASKAGSSPEFIIQRQNQTEGAKTFVLSNVGSFFLDKLRKDVQVVVENGTITCVATDCSSTMKAIRQDSLAVIDIQKGHITPGFVAVGSSLGLVEIPSEPSTVDGKVKASESQNSKAIVHAVDGVKLGTRHLEVAYEGGVLTAITAPVSANVIAGISAAFKTDAESLLSEGSLISSAAALHIQIGNVYKSDVFPSVSAQINFVRQILTANVNADNDYGRAARGEIPTVVHVHNKDEIASVIRLKQKDLPAVRFVILGGAESHLVAGHLAEAGIPVILRPVLCTPSQFDSIHCLTGAPLTNGTAAHVLHHHGVKLAIGVSDDGNARNLIWDAGWLVPTDPLQQLTEEDAIRFISSNLLEIFGLDDKNLLNVDEFIVWSGSPLDMESRRVLIHSQNGIHWLE
ncbi:hypothetical protein EC973_003039 [Apophysomyces ossiformis]|uniref:Amidohydrolase-related domain-containing protein n=1 Tax=Apophysomyces ossiformis TaxID=679940 RepID=A0A8H7BTL7_9FUNG|nr:hypothetical protein EC973_003039 [Apophysomyces ossiformis]